MAEIQFVVYLLRITNIVAVEATENRQLVSFSVLCVFLKKRRLPNHKYALTMFLGTVALLYQHHKLIAKSYNSYKLRIFSLQAHIHMEVLEVKAVD